MENIKPKIFLNLKKLVHLDFSNNKIKILPNDVFCNLKELNLLNFNNNLITELKNGTFLNLKKLKTLIFSSNKITGFPDIFETFENCLELLHFKIILLKNYHHQYF
jgi:Leucine-rich repeat (LRR) protein